VAPLVTISASYGAGGSEVGPAVAERLGVPFVDRAIVRQVADRLAVPLADAERRDEAIGGALGRLLRELAPIGLVFGSPMPVITGDDDGYCAATEQAIREHTSSGAVILGRAGALVLRDVPTALHVRLDGPRERRIEQAMRIEGVDRVTAAERVARADRDRTAYVRHFYHADPADPGLYDLVIDSTRIGLDACVSLIETAARMSDPRALAAGAGPPAPSR
jgi:cytidylate kinase